MLQSFISSSRGWELFPLSMLDIATPAYVLLSGMLTAQLCQVKIKKEILQFFIVHDFCFPAIIPSYGNLEARRFPDYLSAKH